ncbi:MAG: hypothetical protein EA424_04265 [Planctomycetaceae bacterium]|nr:MAG: hypothetical protein EA424_04265 [Planctomycetaceae bacterium]
MNPVITRRTFTKTSMAAALGMTALQTTSVVGAYARVRLGGIAIGGRECPFHERVVQLSSR